MKTIPLLPHIYKKIGWFALPFTLALGIACLHFEFELDFLDIKRKEGHIFLGKKLNLTNEFALSFFLINLLFLSYAKEKQEDEFVNHLRLTSFQWAVLFNTLLIFISNWLVHDFDFLYVTIYAMFSTLIFYIIRFNILHYRTKHEK